MLKKACALWVMLSALGGAQMSLAAPFVPLDGAQMLERLRERAFDAPAKELRALRATLSSNPNNVALAARVARRYIEESRAQGDPRFLGYAQAALSPWWQQAAPPAAVLLLRATIRQSNHDFDAARDDLARLLKDNPKSAQAWLTLATILQVKGEYDKAASACDNLAPLAPTYAATCAAHVIALTGQGAQGYEQLAAALQKIPAAAPDQKVWLETSLAEIAARLGRVEVAEAHFKRALQHSATDPYLKGAYADFLLDAARPAEVVALLKDDIRIDALVLRLALAEQALRAPTLAQHVATLQARFDAVRARGDTVHRREEARFYTTLRGLPAEGLRLAQANWAVQKESADARVLLEAAAALNQPEAAQPVIDWMRKSKIEDATLTRRIRRLPQ